MTDVTIAAGEDMVICRCRSPSRVKGKKVERKWRKEHQLLSVGRLSRFFSFGKNNNHLRVTQIRPSDAGLYNCGADRSSQHTFNVTVVGDALANVAQCQEKTSKTSRGEHISGEERAGEKLRRFLASKSYQPVVKENKNEEMSVN